MFAEELNKGIEFLLESKHAEDVLALELHCFNDLRGLI
jgi:hypothetical protein